MSKYFPFGEQMIPTQEQIEKEKEKFRRYDYYGIPYGYFDDLNMGEGYETEKDMDREEARFLIMKGENIPADLEKRLLYYKQQDMERQEKLTTVY